MKPIRHDPEAHRFEQAFEGPNGQPLLVFADYARQGETLAILHVEADPALRGGGAAGRFMQSLVNEARDEGLKLRPVCGYAAAWFRRHPEAAGVLAH